MLYSDMSNHARLVFLAWMLGAAVTSTVAQDETPSAFNNVILKAPPVPSPPPPTKFALQLGSTAQSVSGLSIPHTGSFLGFSIEMSVANQIGMCPALFFVARRSH